MQTRKVIVLKWKKSGKNLKGDDETDSEVKQRSFILILLRNIEEKLTKVLTLKEINYMISIYKTEVKVV